MLAFLGIHVTGAMNAGDVVVGGCTLVLAAVSLATHSGATMAVAALTDLLGHFFVLFAILRVGIHAPIRPLPLRPIRSEAAA